MKQFKGKAIYNPRGKANEYSYWACNFYTGCSNDCDYCYCKKGFLSRVWSNEPKLKSCFRDEMHAAEVFEKELKQNISELQYHGLFFSFTTDPMLFGSTWESTLYNIQKCYSLGIPVKILTKMAEWVLDDAIFEPRLFNKSLTAFGFTLTGHDELEPNASSNAERILAIRKLHEAGYKTFASIEPIIDFPSAKEVIGQSMPFCDLYKIGLLSGGKYDRVEALNFVEWLSEESGTSMSGRVYIKESLRKLIGDEMSNYWGLFVDRDYNIFSTEIE